MKADAMVIINYQGYVQGPSARAFRSIYRTVSSAGLHVDVWYNYPRHFSDIIFIASEKAYDFAGISMERLNECCKSRDYMLEFLKAPIKHEEIDQSDAILMEDDKPVLDMINARAILEWRQYAIISYTRENIRQGVGLFE